MTEPSLQKGNSEGSQPNRRSGQMGNPITSTLLIYEARPKHRPKTNGSPTARQPPLRSQPGPTVRGTTQFSPPAYGNGGLRRVGFPHHVPPDKNIELRVIHGGNHRVSMQYSTIPNQARMGGGIEGTTPNAQTMGSKQRLGSAMNPQRDL